VKFVVLTAISMKPTIFRGVTPCPSVNNNSGSNKPAAPFFKEHDYFLKMEALLSSNVLVPL